MLSPLIFIITISFPRTRQLEEICIHKRADVDDDVNVSRRGNCEAHEFSMIDDAIARHTITNRNQMYEGIKVAA